jgi:hypothetical protein
MAKFEAVSNDIRPDIGMIAMLPAEGEKLNAVSSKG